MRKRWLQALTLAIVPFIGSLIVRLIYWSCSKSFRLPEAEIGEEAFIVGMWHGDLLMEPYLYKQMRQRMNIKVMISEHFDGRLIAKTVSYLGLDTIYGSSSKGGARVLLKAINAIKQGSDVAITPDGPRGPRHSVADGIIILAQKSGAKIIPYGCKPSRYWQLKSWDRFTIPKPFCHLEYYAGEPLDIRGMDFEAARSLVKMEMMKHVPDTL